jgi:hypothetical protein
MWSSYIASCPRDAVARWRLCVEEDVDLAVVHISPEQLHARSIGWVGRASVFLEGRELLHGPNLPSFMASMPGTFVWDKTICHVPVLESDRPSVTCLSVNGV